MRFALLCLALILAACGGSSDTIAPPPPVPANVIVITAVVHEDGSSDRVTVMLDNKGGNGDYYLEFWGFPIPTSPIVCPIGACQNPQPQQKMGGTAVTPVGLSYNESLVFQLPPLIASIKVFTRSNNSAVVTQTDCYKVRDYGVCP